MNAHRSYWLLLAALLIVTGALAQCGAPQTVVVTQEVEKVVTMEVEKIVTQEVEKVVTQEVEKEVVVTATAAPPSAEAQARAETLNIAVSSKMADPENFNIYGPSDNRDGTGQIQMVFEYFFQLNKMTDEYVPWLAESYEYNDDFTAITVKLRPEVYWNDGQPFTADDVIFTYDLLMNNPGMIWAAETQAWVQSVDKIDELTVQFNLTKSNPRFHQVREAFPANMGWSGITILPKHIWEGQDPLTFKNYPPVGTGPYKLVNSSGSAISYERRDDWWGTTVFGVTPAPKYVNWIYVGSETGAALAMAAGELDLPQMNFSLSSYRAVTDRNPNVRTWYKDAPYASLDPCPSVLMVQNAHAPWDKKEARWALSYMIDRAALVELAYEGTTVPAWGVWPDYPGLQPYFDAVADLRAQYPTTQFDPAKADELLAAAGYTKGADGVWASVDGNPLAVTYLIDADNFEERKVANVVADQLRAGGLEVEILPMTGGPLSDAILRGDYDLKLNAFCPGLLYDNLELFHGKYWVPLGEKAPWYERNSFRYQNADLDAILDEMSVTPPTAVDQITDQYQRAMAIWLPDLPVVPLVQKTNLLPFNTTYWQGWPDEDNPWIVPMHWDAIFEWTVTGYPSTTEAGKWVGGLQPATGQ